MARRIEVGETELRNCWVQEWCDGNIDANTGHHAVSDEFSTEISRFAGEIPERQTLPMTRFAASIVPQLLMAVAVPCRWHRPFGNFCRDLDRKFEIAYKLAAATDRASSSAALPLPYTRLEVPFRSLQTGSRPCFVFEPALPRGVASSPRLPPARPMPSCSVEAAIAQPPCRCSPCPSPPPPWLPVQRWYIRWSSNSSASRRSRSPSITR